MKAGNSILDADMAMLAGWVRSGLSWWTGELRAMLPAWLRRSGRGFASVVHWRGAGEWDRSGRGMPVVLVDPAQCLLRRITLPPLADGDLQRLVALDADRILPLPPVQLVIGAGADPADRMQVTIAGLPRTAATQLAQDLAAADIAPSRVGVADPAEPDRMAVDLSRVIGEIVPLAGRDGARGAWWAIAGFLFAVNLGVLVWRDMQSVARLEELVGQQASAVNTARLITRRIGAASRTAGELAARRERHDPLDALAAVSRALPDNAWVQNLAWDGTMIRLSGYRAGNADVVGALRRSGRFTAVRLAGTEAMAEVPAGQPFDVSAQIVTPGQ
jgi:hypothetical protein